MKKQILALALLLSGGLYAVPLVFNGGDGSPLSMSFSGRIDYTVTTGYSNKGLAFVLGGQGSPFIDFSSSTEASVNGFYFTINGGGQYYLKDIIRKRDVNSNSIQLESAEPVTIAAGDIVAFYGGIATTTQNIFASAPKDGEYSSILMTSTGFLTSNGFGIYTAIPEPSSFSWISGVLIFCVAMVRRPSRPR